MKQELINQYKAATKLEFTVLKCAGNEWGVYSNTSKCFVVHWNTKKEANEHCHELNEMVKNDKPKTPDYFHE